jgi:rhamnogalacturonan endolyase
MAAFAVALCAGFSQVRAQDVTLRDNGATVTLANGYVTAAVTKSNAKVTSLIYRGRQMVNTASNGYIYFSMDGGASYEQPSGCVYSVRTGTADMVDISLKRIWNRSPHAFDIDVHYVLRRGDSGLYVYAVLDHPSSYPVTSVGEWRMVWKLPSDLLERIYVDDLRNWQMPSANDFRNAQRTSIAEVVLLTTGVRAGKYDCKYEFSANYWDLGTYGHASDTNQIGAWLVFGSHEFFNDGPTKNDLTSADRIIHVHFGMNHYNGSGIRVAAGETWRKMFGPYLLYLNYCPDGGDACWADAQARAQAEQAAWPYDWLTGNGEYPLASGRGTVTGQFVVNDTLKPDVSGAGAWVGLAQPAPGGNWQFESKRYQYWVQADVDGSFSIPNVRPGAYTLYAFTTGAVGEYSMANVTVTAGGTTALGALIWNVPHPGSSIAWEIGVPDRTAKEFWHGSTDYYEPFLWEQFSTEFANPLEYNVDSSDWTTDWNYVHSAYKVGATRSPWKWRINFNLPSVPRSGNATLTLAFASANSARVDIFVNDESDRGLITRLYPSVSGGNALIREGIHAKYGVNYVSIPVSRLRMGANTITLVEGRVTGDADHVMYDYVSLELP